jgi:hypothetical protein
MCRFKDPACTTLKSLGATSSLNLCEQRAGINPDRVMGLIPFDRFAINPNAFLEMLPGRALIRPNATIALMKTQTPKVKMSSLPGHVFALDRVSSNIKSTTRTNAYWESLVEALARA